MGIKRKLGRLGKWAGKGALIAGDIVVPARTAAVRTLIAGRDDDDPKPDTTPVAGPLTAGGLSAAASGGLAYAIIAALGIDLTPDELFQAVGAVATLVGTAVGAWRRLRAVDHDG